LIECNFVFCFFSLHPEFVRKYPTPLCSDAFSPFIQNNERSIHEDEIRQATNVLRTQNVPQFANVLRRVSPELRENYPLIQSLHAYGINCRYLGLVRSSLNLQHPKEIYWSQLLLLEMVARTIKEDIRRKQREKMRKRKQTDEEPYRV
jgi:hypothetical protein